MAIQHVYLARSPLEPVVYKFNKQLHGHLFYLMCIFVWKHLKAPVPATLRTVIFTKKKAPHTLLVIC